MSPFVFIVILTLASGLAIYLSVVFGLTSSACTSMMCQGANDAVSAASDVHIDVMLPPGYIDGVPVTQHMRVLLMSQRRQKDNGIYEMVLRGLVRASDNARPKLVRGSRMVYISGGEKYGGMVMMSRVLKTYDVSYTSPDLQDNWPPVVFMPLDVGQRRALAIPENVLRADEGWT